MNSVLILSYNCLLRKNSWRYSFVNMKSSENKTHAVVDWTSFNFCRILQVILVVKAVDIFKDNEGKLLGCK